MRPYYGIIIVLLVATALRIAWVYAGLPYVVEVDSYKFVYFAREMFLSGNLQPLHFQNPALYTYLLVILNYAFDIESEYMSYLVARMVSVVSGVGLVWLVWAMASNCLKRIPALLASGLVATDVLLVTLSRAEKTDMLLVFLMTLGLWAVARTHIRSAHVFVAALAVGLSVATKWTGLYLMMFLGLSSILTIIRNRRAAPPIAALSSTYLMGLAVFLAVNPYFLSYFDVYWERFLHEASIQRFGNIGSVQAGWLDYFWSEQTISSAPWLGASMRQNQGILFLAFATAGALLVVYRRSWILLLHLVYVLFYFLLIINPGHLMAPRFIAPVLPSLAILCAYGVQILARAFKARSQQALIMSSLLVLITPLINSSTYVRRATGEMTQISAANWIANNLPRDAVVNVSHFYLDNFRFLPQEFRKIPNVPSRMNRFPNHPELNGEQKPIYHPGLVEEFRSEGIEYVITNSWFDDSFNPNPGNSRWFPNSVASFAAWQEKLESESRLVWSINADDSGVLGPDIYIYALKTEE